MEPRGSLLPHRASLIPSPLASAWEPSAGTVPTALPPGGSPSVGGIVGHRLAWDRRTGEKSREYGRPLSLRGHCVSDGPHVNDGRGTPGRAPGLADRRSGGPQGRRLTRTVAPESLRSRRLRWTVPEVLPWGCRCPGDGRGGPSRPSPAGPPPPPRRFRGQRSQPHRRHPLAEPPDGGTDGGQGSGPCGAARPTAFRGRAANGARRADARELKAAL